MKKWYESKAIIGTLILFVALLKSMTGVEILGSEEITLLGNNIEAVVTGVLALIGLFTSIYGRFTAKGKIEL